MFQICNHWCSWYSLGALNIDFRLFGKSDTADLQSGYFTKSITTVTILNTNSIMLTTKVNIQIPFSLFS